MTATLNQIRDGIVSLLEDGAGSVRTIPTGTFKRVEDITKAKASGAPRPFVLHLDEETEDEDLPSDVAGQYVHRAWRGQIVVGYADRPKNRYELQAEMIEDERKIFACLGTPRNLSIVADWEGLEASSAKSAFARQPLEPDKDRSPEIHLIVVDFVVSYREDMDA